MASMASMGFTGAHGEKPTASEQQRCCHQTGASHQHTISSGFRQCLHCWQDNFFLRASIPARILINGNAASALLLDKFKATHRMRLSGREVRPTWSGLSVSRDSGRTWSGRGWNAAENRKTRVSGRGLNEMDGSVGLVGREVTAAPYE